MKRNTINHFASLPCKKLFLYTFGSKSFNQKKKIFSKEAKKIFGNRKKNNIYLSQIGKIKFPFFSFGKIKSYDLWDIEDLMIFSYYKSKKNYYEKAIDLGANIGLHTIILKKLGYKTISYEPDKKHYKRLKFNLKINNLNLNGLYNRGIFNKKGSFYFNRIAENTTGSHIVNLKKNPYGKIEKFKIQTDNFINLIKLKKKTIIKMDIEGAESHCLLTTKFKHWKYIDAFVEITDAESSKKIFDHMKKIKVFIFSHKKKWRRVKKYNEMPISYKEGMVFISKKINWLK